MNPDDFLVLTPFGSATVAFPEEGPAVISGEPAAADAVRRELLTATNTMGMAVTLDSASDLDLMAAARAPGSLLTVVPPAGYVEDDGDDEGDPDDMTPADDAMLDAAPADRKTLRATVKTGATLAERLAAARALAQPVAGPVAPLYVNRPVLNSADILAWAASQGFGTTLAADDLHVTVAYSKQPMQWAKVPPQQDTITVTGGARNVQPLGNEGAVVLKFDSPELQQRWQQYRDAGASWDYEGYTPHVTITYQGQGVDLAQVQAYEGPIVLGAERQETLNASKTVAEVAAPAKASAMLDSAAEPAEPPDRGQALATLRAIASGRHPDMLDPELLDRLEDLRAAFPDDAEVLALADEAAARLAKGPG